MENTNLLKLIGYMSEVEKYQKALDSLSERWDLLTILGQMSHIDMNMSKTRKEFEHLTELLLLQLGQERLKKINLEMNSKAQVAVDIVIRNLFERTADVGFLATDEDIRTYFEYIASKKQTSSPTKKQKSLEQALYQQFEEYVLKYSVYYNIILVDNNSDVVLQLDSNNKTQNTSSPFINEAITTAGEYVEYYGYTDLNPDKEKSLVYAYKVTKDNNPDSEVLGVLVLLFKFEDEMLGVFNNLLNKDDWMNISLLDDACQVISSSDTSVIPLGATMQKALNDKCKIVRFAGQEYLSKTCKTKGYQGFFGLDWSGHVMIPLAHAFDTSSEDITSSLDKETLEMVIQNSNLFGKELITIPKEAEKIQKELDVTVWNGNVKIANSKTTDNSFSRSLLSQISKTGLKTKTIFEDSIGNLNNTVISSILNDGLFLAKLAIDIMDRNLYERANDSRWWALTTFFRKTLKTEHPNAEKMSSILTYINNLYTVYSNLFIYDKQGVVIAVSNNDEKHLIGNRLNDPWVNETLNITSSQQYSVSSFKKTSLYRGKHTYIYGASITDIDNTNEVLGGIGVVFDSEPEFHAMLQETLPTKTDDAEKNSCFAVFCDNEKNIISSTSLDICIGDCLEIDHKFFALKAGQSHVDIIEYNNKHYSVTAAASKGYREYKINDNYQNDVIAIIFTEVANQNKTITTDLQITSYSFPKPQTGEETVDISTFFLGKKIYGIESKYIISSLNNQPLTKIIGVDDYLIGVTNYRSQTISVVSLYSLITGEEFHYNHSSNDIILLKFDVMGKEQYLGLAIDSIYDSAEIAKKDLQEHNSNQLCQGSLSKYIVRPQKNMSKTELLSILDIQAMYKRILTPKTSTTNQT